MPGAFGLLSTHTTSNPRSCSWPVTAVPTLPSPTTMMCPLAGRGARRTEPVSRAPTTMAVITGMKAMPSTVSITCATFSAGLSCDLVSADPVRSIRVRYSASLSE